MENLFVKLSRDDLTSALQEIKELVDNRYDYGNQPNCLTDIQDVLDYYLND